MPPLPPLRVAPACAKGGEQFQEMAFVHINKAGGTWMRSQLMSHARHQMVELTDHTAMPKMRALGARFFHATAALQQQVLGAEVWERAYTFALVRNPFARQLSMFTFLLQEASCNKPIGVRPPHCEERRLPAPGPWLEQREQVAARFKEWIKALAAAFPLGTPKAHLFGARSHGNEYHKWYNASQTSWLVDGHGKLLVKKVIRLEDLNAEWPALQKAVCGLQRASVSSTTRRNPSSHEHYSFYYDDETRRIVEAYSAPDFARFGYKFDKPA